MLSRVVGTNHHHHGAKPSALRPSYQPSAPRPTYHFIWPIHHYQHHHHSAELPAPRPTPWSELLPLITITIGNHGAKPSFHPSAPRLTYHFIRPIHHYQSPPPFGRAISAEAHTMGRVITIDHHPHWAEPSVPRPTFHFILQLSHYYQSPP